MKSVLIEEYNKKEKQFLKETKDLVKKISKNFTNEFLVLFKKYPYVKAIYFNMEKGEVDDCFFSFDDGCGDYTADPGNWIKYKGKILETAKLMEEFNKLINSIPKAALECVVGKNNFKESDVTVCIDKKGKLDLMVDGEEVFLKKKVLESF